MQTNGNAFSRIWQAAFSRLFHLCRVAPHLQANENFDVAGIAAGLGRVNTTLAKGRRELRPLLFQFGPRAFLVG